MQAKPDLKLMLYAAALLLLPLAAVCVAAVFFFPIKAAAAVISAAAALFVLLSVYLFLYRKSTEYIKTDDMLIVKSGIVFRRTIYLFLNRTVSVISYSLPFSCGFMLVRCTGGSALLLTDKIKVEERWEELTI